MLRRLKKDVMSQLPPKRRQVVRLPPPKPEDWPDYKASVFFMLPRNTRSNSVQSSSNVISSNVSKTQCKLAETQPAYWLYPNHVNKLSYEKDAPKKLSYGMSC